MKYNGSLSRDEIELSPLVKKQVSASFPLGIEITILRPFSFSTTFFFLLSGFEKPVQCPGRLNAEK